MSEFIFMLTQDDVTRCDALDVYDSVRGIDGLKMVGFKDVGLDPQSNRALVKEIHDDRRLAFLEVVSDSESASWKATELGLSLGVDYLIGTFSEFASSTFALIRGTAMKFMPYAGKAFGHPCSLDGSLEELRDDARRLEEEGVDGLNVLAYRHVSLAGEAVAEAVTAAVDIPVVVAGSISTKKQVTQMGAIGVWAFTIGGAVFEQRFVQDGSVEDNVRRILEFANGA